MMKFNKSIVASIVASALGATTLSAVAVDFSKNGTPITKTNFCAACC